MDTNLPRSRESRPSRSLEEEPHESAQSDRMLQMQHDMAGLPVSEQAERLRPAAPFTFHATAAAPPVQRQADGAGESTVASETSSSGGTTNASDSGTQSPTSGSRSSRRRFGATLALRISGYANREEFTSKAIDALRQRLASFQIHPARVQATLVSAEEEFGSLWDWNSWEAGTPAWVKVSCRLSPEYGDNSIALTVLDSAPYDWRPASPEPAATPTAGPAATPRSSSASPSSSAGTRGSTAASPVSNIDVSPVATTTGTPHEYPVLDTVTAELGLLGAALETVEAVELGKFFELTDTPVETAVAFVRRAQEIGLKEALKQVATKNLEELTTTTGALGGVGAVLDFLQATRDIANARDVEQGAGIGATYLSTFFFGGPVLSVARGVMGFAELMFPGLKDSTIWKAIKLLDPAEFAGMTVEVVGRAIRAGYYALGGNWETYQEVVAGCPEIMSLQTFNRIDEVMNTPGLRDSPIGIAWQLGSKLGEMFGEEFQRELEMRITRGEQWLDGQTGGQLLDTVVENLDRLGQLNRDFEGLLTSLFNDRYFVIEAPESTLQRNFTQFIEIEEHVLLVLTYYISIVNEIPQSRSLRELVIGFMQDLAEAVVTNDRDRIINWSFDPMTQSVPVSEKEANIPISLDNLADLDDRLFEARAYEQSYRTFYGGPDCPF
jgi:hypothetical protein